MYGFIGEVIMCVHKRTNPCCPPVVFEYDCASLFMLNVIMCGHYFNMCLCIFINLYTYPCSSHVDTHTHTHALTDFKNEQKVQVLSL